MSEFIDRPPRIQPILPIEEKRIPSPPQKDKKGITEILQAFLPMITIFGFLFMGASGGNRNPLFVLPMALAGFATTGFAIYGYLEEKREQERKEKAYNERLIELTKEMHGYHDQQRRFYSYSYADTPTTFRLVDDAKYEVTKDERSLRAESRLWERRVDDEDFTAIRLGMGTLPSTVVYTLEQVDSYEDPLARAALKLQEDSKFVHDIPVIIQLRPPRGGSTPGTSETKREETEEAKEEEARRTPVTTALGISGDRDSVYKFTRAVLANFVVFHPPADARIFVLANSEREWKWTDDLPHTTEDENSRLSCFLDRKGKKGADSLPNFSENLRKILSQRKLQMGDREDNDGGGEDPTLPFLLVVVDLMDTAYNQESPLYELETDPAFAILLAEGAMLGASVIFMVPERAKIPSSCQGVIEVERTSPASNSKQGDFQRIHFRYAETGLNTFRYVGAADSVSTRDEMQVLSKKLAQLQMRASSGSKLPSVVAFMSMMGFTSMDDLLEKSLKNWEIGMEPRYADWLRAPVGMMAGRKLRTLNFSAKKDGVHGMVAGSTGSGKSELLISMITAMAVIYDPSALNFVLVDYKGGGAFKEFEELPHCVDIITNLAGEGVTRMFTAINAELRRRQKLNVDTGTKNIVDYRQKGLHKTVQPYPFLFIIVDEFAEMIADRAEYKAELETITRVGRAQGVSLILAAQRPSGVTDQMRSNIKFRISLRVETAGESREMLRRPEAAYLPSGIPGRGYLQVGNDEIELIQVAYSGDKYEDPGAAPREPVIWPDRGDIYNPERDQEPPELYKVIITNLDALAKKAGIPAQGAPWPAFLPTRFGLTTPLISNDPAVEALTFERYLDQNDIPRILFGGDREPVMALNPWLRRWMYDQDGWNENPDWETQAIRPIIGIIDNPYAAKQLPLTVDFPMGHAAIFGTSGWGKSTFIKTLVVSLAATHSPSHVHIYIMDLGGRSLGILNQFPHVGAVINPDEEGYRERIEQLLRQLHEILEERKNILSSAGVGDIYQYNALHPDKALPAVIVALDNLTEFIETFAEGPDNVETIYDKLIGITRECKPFGVHMIFTASGPSVMNMKVSNLFSQRYALKLTDPSDNREVIGVTMPEGPEIAGRGYVKLDRVGLSFQVALPLEPNRSNEEDGTSENDEIKELAESMRAHMAASGRKYNLPLRVGSLPGSVLFKTIFARENNVPVPIGDPTFNDHVREITRKKWAASMDPKNAGWLRVNFFLAPGDRLREMRLEAKRDGVHGLIAGGTGAGKSELLMALIVGLALNYDPSILNFVLVDYKGGGAFKPFENMPHCVDSISNLNKSAVRRMFTSINAEMQRRQKMSADTGTKDIVEYREKGYHLTIEPFPHLFIIIDEYAEMISDTPEFKAELESITRVGRSAGVNLLLAAQRPVGVTDQMRANIKFRICLRVEETETSREMLRRSDAAFLPSVPGRGYLQVGNDGIELVQVAYTGENHPYGDLVMDNNQTPKFYDAMVAMTQEILEGEMPRTPWPPFLPPKLTFDEDPGESYLDANYLPLMTLDHKVKTRALNPFLTEWMDGKGKWHGVDWTRHAMRGIVGMVDDPYGARRLPLIIDFSKGHVALFGASGWGKTTLYRSLILSLAATHSPDEFQAHILDLGGRNLEVLKALPHVGTIIMPDEAGYEERVQQLMRELNATIDRRKRMYSEHGYNTLFEYNANTPDKIEPAILVVIDNFGEYIETFGGSSAKENDPNNMMEALVALVRSGRAYGIHVMVNALRLNTLSAKLLSLFTERLTLRLADADDYSGIVGSRIPEIEEIGGRGYMRVDRLPLGFQVALPPGTVENGQIKGEARQIRAIGKMMDDYTARGTHEYKVPFRITALPRAVMHRQIIQTEYETRPDKPLYSEVFNAMKRTWERNGSAEHADWLRATLGVASGNRNRTLRLEAKHDGVHGMIAGGTGSGKSEILMTLLVSLAMNYSPEILNFVLVDYKGGGAFKAFETLPHCVDIVTNLNKSAVVRMFTSINAEIRRRQKMNADTGTKDIVEYRSKGLHLNGGEPYPHLFVIIDEYAEMIDDNEAFKAELESITRVGRAQGVNLLLASQRPKGVTDQMRANIKLRLCLRVEETDTSMEMLRRNDAAFLPNGMPGRGYLQIGNDNFELMQVSYTGEKAPEDRPAPVLYPDRPTPPPPTGDDIPRLFDAIVNLSKELVAGKKTRKPWPAFLPTQISLQSSIVTGDGLDTFILQSEVGDWLNNETEALWQGINWRDDAMRPVTGLVDDPVEASQSPLRFNMGREHLVAYGDAGWGKTSFLRAMIVSLAASHSPDEFHCYVLDLGGRNFRALEDLPHMGAVIYADEENYEERLHRLMDRMTRLADERAQILSDAGANTLYEYNEIALEKGLPILPAVLVAIDNWAPLQETQDALVESVITPLLRRSLTMGISFVVTANGPNNLYSKVQALMGQRITFKQAQTDRLMDIVGRGVVEMDDIPGRGYIRMNRRPLFYQAALPVGIFAGDEGRDTRPEAEEMRLLALNMKRKVASGEFEMKTKPDPITTLPQIVPLISLLDETPPLRRGRVELVPGRGSNLRPTLIDLRRMAPHFVVMGPPRSGKTTQMYSLLFSLCHRNAPANAQVVIIDLTRKFARYGGQHTLEKIPHVLSVLYDIEGLEALVEQLKAEAPTLAGSEREIFVFIDSLDDAVEDIEGKRAQANDLTMLIRRYGTEGMHFIISGGTSSGMSSEMRRRIQNANFGIGLKTPAAVEAFNVMRTPAVFRSGRELPAGRGFTVRLGQPVMIQGASPYEGMGVVVNNSGDEGDEEAAIIAALDKWVELLVARYPYDDQKAAWKVKVEAGAASGGEKKEDGPAMPVQSEESAKLMTLLQKAMQYEAHKLKESGADPILLTLLAKQQGGIYSDDNTAMHLLKTAWRNEQIAMGVGAEMVAMMMDSMDANSLKYTIEDWVQSLPDVELTLPEESTTEAEAITMDFGISAESLARAQAIAAANAAELAAEQAANGTSGSNGHTNGANGTDTEKKEVPEATPGD